MQFPCPNTEMKWKQEGIPAEATQHLSIYYAGILKSTLTTYTKKGFFNI